MIRRRVAGAVILTAAALLLAVAIAAVADDAATEPTAGCDCEQCQPTHTPGDYAPYTDPELTLPPLSDDDLVLAGLLNVKPEVGGEVTP